MEEEKQTQQDVHPAHENASAQTPGKKCLNCGAMLTGHYCSDCGQKDEDLEEPFWKLFADAFADFWHFDSKFFITIFPLLFRPGFLTKEYVAGRRVRYVHPIRLYFFLSVLFFLFYFSLSSKGLLQYKPVTANDLKTDTAKQRELAQLQDTINQALKGNSKLRVNFSPKKINTDGPGINEDISFEGHLPATVAAYEDSIHKLPKDSMPGFFQQIFDKQSIEAKEKGEREVFSEISETVNHNLPKIMFVLLPVFALLLKLLYIRRRVYFVDHAVFSLHFHSFAFLIFLLAFLITLIFTKASLGGWVILILLIYLFFALRKMHRQSVMKTLTKIFLLLISYSVFIAIVFLCLIIYAAMTL